MPHSQFIVDRNGNPMEYQHSVRFLPEDDKVIRAYFALCQRRGWTPIQTCHTCGTDFHVPENKVLIDISPTVLIMRCRCTERIAERAK